MPVQPYTIVKETKDYITIKIPRTLVRRAGFSSSFLTAAGALKILREGMKEYREGKTKKLTSLHSFRSNGHRV